MARRYGPVAFVVAAALADRYGTPGVAFELLLAAVPVAAVAALLSAGELLDGRAHHWQVAFPATALAFVVLAAAARAPAVAAGVVPALSRSALVACLAVYCLQALTAVAAELWWQREDPRPALEGE